MEREIVRELLAFINESPSCYHAAASAARRLEAAGYRRVPEEEAWRGEPAGPDVVAPGGAAQTCALALSA